jgi:hypothetical protein
MRPRTPQRNGRQRGKVTDHGTQKKKHINYIFARTGPRDRARLVGYAFRNGLVIPADRQVPTWGGGLARGKVSSQADGGAGAPA